MIATICSTFYVLAFIMIRIHYPCVPYLRSIMLTAFMPFILIASFVLSVFYIPKNFVYVLKNALDLFCQEYEWKRKIKIKTSK